MSTERGLDKEDVVCIYNGIQIGIKKEQNDVIFSNRDCHTE